MKKIGIVLAALVITMFFVSAVAAMPANNPPEQREKFREDSAVQGEGYIFYEKTVLDKAIAVDVYERMEGHTGSSGNGSFAMTITEILNEGVRLNHEGNGSYSNITDPIYGDMDRPVMTNFECKKMIQFETVQPNGYGLSGIATYKSPGFHGGLNAEVTERYGNEVKDVVTGARLYAPVRSLQKDETITMTTTATYNDTCREWEDRNPDRPYNANELNFDTKNAFFGAWETESSWTKVCAKDVEHRQQFIGDFQVDKNLIFKEEVTDPCPDKEPPGDC